MAPAGAPFVEYAEAPWTVVDHGAGSRFLVDSTGKGVKDRMEVSIRENMCLMDPCGSVAPSNIQRGEVPDTFGRGMTDEEPDGASHRSPKG